MERIKLFRLARLKNNNVCKTVFRKVCCFLKIHVTAGKLWCCKKSLGTKKKVSLRGGRGMVYIASYLLIVNIIALIMMQQDKQKAVKNEWRIRERSLWFVALFGGSVGIWIGMRQFRHKTNHTSFRLGIPLLTACQIVLLSYVLHFLS